MVTVASETLAFAEERRAALARALAPVLPAHCLLLREEERAPFDCDGLSVFRQTPLAVALPETAEQVREVLRVCHRLRVPIVARGAGTGLSGGAMPHADGVV